MCEPSTGTCASLFQGSILTAIEILSRLAGLHVGLSVSNGQIRARMTRPGLPIPEEARQLIAEVKPHVVQLLQEPAKYKRPGLPGRCRWCREWEQAGRHRRPVLACSECDEEVT